MIGYAECEFRLYNCQSLKEKRAVLQKVITRCKQKFNISIAEMNHQDRWQLTSIGLVTISSSKKVAEKELNQAIQFLDSFPEWERTITNFEWL